MQEGKKHRRLWRFGELLEYFPSSATPTTSTRVPSSQLVISRRWRCCRAEHSARKLRVHHRHPRRVLVVVPAKLLPASSGGSRRTEIFRRDLVPDGVAPPHSPASDPLFASVKYRRWRSSPSDNGGVVHQSRRPARRESSATRSIMRFCIAGTRSPGNRPCSGRYPPAWRSAAQSRDAVQRARQSAHRNHGSGHQHSADGNLRDQQQVAHGHAPPSPLRPIPALTIWYGSVLQHLAHGNQCRRGIR